MIGRSFAELAWRALAWQRPQVYIFSNWQSESFVHVYDSDRNRHFYGVSRRFWEKIREAYYRETGDPIEESYIDLYVVEPTNREVTLVMSAPSDNTTLSTMSQPLGHELVRVTEIHITEEGAWIQS